MCTTATGSLEAELPATNGFLHIKNLVLADFFGKKDIMVSAVSVVTTENAKIFGRPRLKAGAGLK